MLRPSLLFSALLLLAPAAEAQPGVVFEIENTDHYASPEEVTTMMMHVAGSNLAMDMPHAAPGMGSSRAIFLGDEGETGEMIVIQDDEKSYMRLDEETITMLTEKVQQARAAVDEAMKNLSEEQQRQLREMQQQQMQVPGAPDFPWEIERVKTDEEAEVEGYPCVKYVSYINGTMRSESWVTPMENVDGADLMRPVFEKMQAFQEKMSDQLSQLPGMGDPDAWAQFEDGYPVLTIMFDEEGNVWQKSRLLSAKPGDVDPAVFQVPDEYEPMNLGM